jgi:RNase H-fold protein (predicted Holliday junction resolvase)
MKRVVEEFVGVLRGVVGCEVEVWNEQMTSAMVLKQRREMGLEKGQVDVDAAAAAVMLGDFWEYKKRAQG